jgi:hypothetical protein
MDYPEVCFTEVIFALLFLSFLLSIFDSFLILFYILCTFLLSLSIFFTLLAFIYLLLLTTFFQALVDHLTLFTIGELRINVFYFTNKYCHDVALYRHTLR